MEQWLEKDGFKVVKSGGELTIQGNVFNAWEPTGAARYWGGWAANPGVGLELLFKANGKIVGRDAAQGQGLDPARCGRERPRGHDQRAVEGSLVSLTH